MSSVGHAEEVEDEEILFTSFSVDISVYDLGTLKKDPAVPSRATKIISSRKSPRKSVLRGAGRMLPVVFPGEPVFVSP